MFGIADEGLYQQYNYLVQEEETPGVDGAGTHGPDAVISYLHSYLSKCPGGSEISLHADNCAGRLLLLYI